jgi:hypothetical protein
MFARLPDPPEVNPFTRTMLENPSLPVAVTLVLAAWLIVTGLRQGDLRRQGAGAGFALLGVLLLVLAWVVVTPGERARAVTRGFVEAVVARDLVGAVDRLGEDAALTIGSTTSEGFDRDRITSLLSWFAAQYRVRSNRISLLRGYTTGRDRAVAHLSCVTEVEGGYGPTVSQWVFEVTRDAGGAWTIHRLAWISANGRHASRSMVPLAGRE